MITTQESAVLMLLFLIFSLNGLHRTDARSPYSCKLRSYKQEFKPSDTKNCRPTRFRLTKCIGSCPSSAFPSFPNIDGEMFKKVCECCNAKVSPTPRVKKFKGVKCQETASFSVIVSCECKPCHSRYEL